MGDPDASNPELLTLRRACLQWLQNAKRAGVSHVPWPGGEAGILADKRKKLDATSGPPRPKVAARPDESPSVPIATAKGPTTASRNPTPKGLWHEVDTLDESPPARSLVTLPILPEGLLDVDQRDEHFASLRSLVCQCTQCPELVRSRTQTVFGVGHLKPRFVFFGEAPGADEDQQGEPFVGRAGQLLNKILEASKMKRPDVYIMNALKCRPPNNRTPTDAEIENCRPFFERQLAVLRPEFIVCLGAVAVRAVLGSKQSVGSLRGRFHQAFGAKVLVTYHPSYLLRTESAKKYTWEDMKMLMREAGIPIPGEAR